MGGGHSRFGGSGNLSGRTVRIHGKPYRFDRRLGEGGFGAVYSARSPNGASRAVKVIDLNRLPGGGEMLVQSYLNEVRHLEKLRRVSHHVVRIYDFDFDPRTGQGYIVMELGGDNLEKLIRRLHGTQRGPTPPGTFIDPITRKEVWRQMVSIIRTLTQNEIVHMDLKPDNLLLFGKTLKIADLGISKKPEMLGQPGVGTPLFSAPEVMQARPGVPSFYGPKADVWSLGAILYYMTYGQPPQYHPRASDPPRGQLPARDPALLDVLRRTLVLNPNARASIHQLLHHPYTAS